MTLRDVLVRWMLLRGLTVGVLFFCIEHFVFILQVSVVRVALTAVVMLGVFLVLGLIEHAKRYRRARRAPHSS